MSYCYTCSYDYGYGCYDEVAITNSNVDQAPDPDGDVPLTILRRGGRQGHRGVATLEAGPEHESGLSDRERSWEAARDRRELPLAICAAPREPSISVEDALLYQSQRKRPPTIDEIEEAATAAKAKKADEAAEAKAAEEAAEAKTAEVAAADVPAEPAKKKRQNKRAEAAAKKKAEKVAAKEAKKARRAKLKSERDAAKVAAKAKRAEEVAAEKSQKSVAKPKGKAKAKAKSKLEAEEATAASIGSSEE